MKATLTKLSASELRIEVILPWEEWQKEMDHAAEHLAKEVKIEGFRPGKAPKNLIEQRVGKEAIIAEAAEHAVSHSYPKVLEEHKVEAIGRPKVTLDKVLEGDNLIYTVTTAVMPKVKLSQWEKKVKEINKEYKDKKPEVEEKEIESELDRLAGMRAKLITVNRGAKVGDNVLIDFSVKQDGVVIEGGASQNHPVTLGKGVFIPGFEENLVDAKAGEEKNFKLTFPPEYHAKHLAGKEAEFHVTVRAVQERETPKIDDDFAKSLGNFESLEKVKENMRSGLTEEKKGRLKDERRTKILDALTEHAEAEFPAVLVEEELNRMVREFENQIQGMGFDWNQYLEQTKKTEAEIRTEWEPQAKKRLLAQLALETLGDDQDIKVDNAEIEAEMNKALQYFKGMKDAEKNLDMARLYNTVRGQLRNEKILAWLESR